MKRFARLALSIILCLGAGGIGSVFTSMSVKSWYPAIRKPFFNPPDWIFGPVWTILFIMMGTALFLVWEKRDLPGSGRAIRSFFVQLAVNVLWSAAFFGLRSPLAGLAVIALLLFLITRTIKEFRGVSKAAARLLVPYLAWVGFASVLNLWIMVLNI